jgi:hypothetical protein
MDFDEESGEFGTTDQDAAGAGADQILDELEQAQAQAAADEDAVEAVLSNAIDRIEEANVWKLLIAQNVIDPKSATERVVHSVNQQLKRFALDRLEILLGMNKPKKTEKPLFDPDEYRALRILAAKFNGRPLTSVLSEIAQPQLTQAAPEEKREPRLNTVTLPNTAMRPQQPALQKQAPQQRQPAQRAAPQKTQRRGPGRTAVPTGSSDQGYALPSGPIKPKPMPTPDQMVASAVGVSTPMNIKTEGVNPQQAAQGGANLLQQVVSQLTGGSLIHVDNAAPIDGGVDGGTNERF